MECKRIRKEREDKVAAAVANSGANAVSVGVACGHCGKEPPVTKPLIVCAKCTRVGYCSLECQHAARCVHVCIFIYYLLFSFPNLTFSRVARGIGLPA